MIFNRTEKQEREYLRQIINIIKSTIENTDISVREHVDTLQEYKNYLWSNKDIDPHEIRSMRESILNHFAVGENVIQKRKRLGRILDIPYFGRIDFKENKDGSNAVPIYIGTYTFFDLENKVNLIYDWRAPVSSMFYENELGKASYDSPSGEIEGDVLLKRQFRIRKGKMEYMIESSLTVHDDILQKELSLSADDKMKNIVATIQKEQNRIIRNDDAHVLIIQGVAGSGKTSIALHRIAYLLYAYKGSISSKDILIISPGRVFADYISNVLPELGEEAVPETGMEQILSGVLHNKYKFQSFFEQVTEILNKPNPGFIERIQYKSSFEFITRLDQFILYIENHYFRAKDIVLTKFIIIPAGFIDEQFKRFNRYPMRRRFEAMTDYIADLSEVKYRYTLTATDRNMMKKEIKNMFAGNNDIRLYKDFFEWIGKPEMFKMRKKHTLEYSDMAPLVYLHIALDEYDKNSAIKHLLIDEMQDYTPLQYKILQKLYPCRKTILGDAGQSVNPYGSSTANMIKKVFVTGEIMKLYKSYRSTYEITNFAQKIRPDNDLISVARHGEFVHVLKYENEEEEISGIVGLILSFKKSENQSLGIICKTEMQAEETAERLKRYVNDVYFLSIRSSVFVKGIIVTSVHMAKGLEFDEVVIPYVNNKNYNTEPDRSMLYIGVTRAMHLLTLTYNDEPSLFI